MDLFRNAKVVRLRSHHDKYLVAEEDKESVIQGRNGSSWNALWTVELVPNSQSVICLKSCYNKYLTASNERFLLGATGRKVVQTSLNASLGWEPIRVEGTRVKLKTQYGKFLKANGGLPPWRNSVTHDSPVVTSTHNTIWDVDVVDQNQNESGGRMTMEELNMAASAYFNNSSPEVKKLAQDFFDSMDTDQDGQVSIDEFTDFFKQLDDSMGRSFFAALDRNGNGSLQFGEVLTLNYIIITGQNGRNIPQVQQLKECLTALAQQLEESASLQNLMLKIDIERQVSLSFLLLNCPLIFLLLLIIVLLRLYMHPLQSSEFLRTNTIVVYVFVRFVSHIKKILSPLTLVFFSKKDGSSSLLNA